MGFCQSVKRRALFDDDKLRGCLFGTAVGDALGTPLEFQKRDSGVKITTMQGGGPHHLPPGFWTDDTSMALCLAESLVCSGGFDEKDQMARYLSWYDRGHLGSNVTCFDIGSTTHNALQRFHDDPSNGFCGNPDTEKAGNGSLMRLAPIPLFYRGVSAKEAVEIAGLSSITTHANPMAVSAVQYYTVLVIGALRGETKEKLLSPMYTPAGEPKLWEECSLDKRILEIVDNDKYKKKTRDEISSSGFVVHSLEAALWCFYHAKSFSEGALLAANLADDSDTVAAIYGMLAGAFWGYSSIPENWLKKLALHPLVELFSDSLVEMPRTGVPPVGFAKSHEAFLTAEDNYRSKLYSRVKPGPKRFKKAAEFDEAAAEFRIQSFGKSSEGFMKKLGASWEQILDADREVIRLHEARVHKLGIGGLMGTLKKKRPAGKKKKKKKSVKSQQLN